MTSDDLLPVSDFFTYVGTYFPDFPPEDQINAASALDELARLLGGLTNLHAAAIVRQIATLPINFNRLTIASKELAAARSKVGDPIAAMQHIQVALEHFEEAVGPARLRRIFTAGQDGTSVEPTPP